MPNVFKCKIQFYTICTTVTCTHFNVSIDYLCFKINKSKMYLNVYSKNSSIVFSTDISVYGLIKVYLVNLWKHLFVQ